MTVIDLAAFDAFLFDLDGVITRTAGLRAIATSRRIISCRSFALK